MTPQPPQAGEGITAVAGKPFAAKSTHVDKPCRPPPPPITPLSDWLGDLARMLGADLEAPALKSQGCSARPTEAAVAAPLT